MACLRACHHFIGTEGSGREESQFETEVAFWNIHSITMREESAFTQSIRWYLTGSTFAFSLGQENHNVQVQQAVDRGFDSVPVRRGVVFQLRAGLARDDT